MKDGKYSHKLISERLDNEEGYIISHKFEGEIRDVSSKALINHKTRAINKNDVSEIVEMHEKALQFSRRNRIETKIWESME